MSDRLSHDLASLRIDRKGGPGGGARPSSALRYIGIAVVLVGVAAGAVYLAPRLPTVPSGMEVETTEVALVSPSQSGVDMNGSGYVVPQITVKVSSRVTAKIERVSIQEGSVVHVGDEIFVLDAAAKTSAVMTAEAKVASARARVGTAHAAAAEVQQQLVRQKQLAASGAVAPATVTDLAARAHVLDAQVAAADAELNAVVADRRSIELDLKDMAIRSTINGRAVTRPASVGDLASPEKTLVELVDFNSLLVEVDVAEGRIEQIRAGSPAEIVLDAYPSKRLRGEVFAINPKINRAKATGTVKVKFLEDAQLALPEMAARVSFLKDAVSAQEMAAPPKTIIPANAVVDRGGQKVAFTVVDGHARRVALKLGPPTAGGYEVLDGPVPGTRVVRSPSDRLEDGQTLKVK